MFFPGQTVEFYMTADEALNDRDCFSGQECTEDGADPDAIKAMQDCKRQDDGRDQTAEIKKPRLNIGKAVRTGWSIIRFGSLTSRWRFQRGIH